MGWVSGWRVWVDGSVWMVVMRDGVISGGYECDVVLMLDIECVMECRG